MKAQIVLLSLIGLAVCQHSRNVDKTKKIGYFTSDAKMSWIDAVKVITRLVRTLLMKGQLRPR